MIPLLSSSRPTAAQWNTLFAALDAKLTSVLDGKTWLLTADGAVLSFMGMPFWFVSGARPQTGIWQGVAYDHAVFTAKAAAVAGTVTLHHAEHKIVKITDAISDGEKVAVGGSAGGLFFDRSLEAHRVAFTPDGGEEEEYWLYEEGLLGDGRYNGNAQKLWRFALAEIVMEGPVQNSKLEIQSDWNKFNCFRIHNCNGFEVRIDFMSRDGSEGGEAVAHTITVPRWGCRTVRRYDPLSAVITPASRLVYENGYNYLFKMRAGDPRFYALPQGNGSPLSSMGANNLTSPGLVVRRMVGALAVGLVCYGTGRPRWYVKPDAAFPDVQGLYEGVFGTRG